MEDRLPGNTGSAAGGRSRRPGGRRRGHAASTSTRAPMSTSAGSREDYTPALVDAVIERARAFADAGAGSLFVPVPGRPPDDRGDLRGLAAAGQRAVGQGPRHPRRTRRAGRRADQLRARAVGRGDGLAGRAGEGGPRRGNSALRRLTARDPRARTPRHGRGVGHDGYGAGNRTRGQQSRCGAASPISRW